MALCDLCGKETRLAQAEIEGTTLDVCRDCAKYGKAVKRASLHSRKPRPARREKIFIIVDDYNRRIKQARENMGLKQEDLAKQVAEKESVIHWLESKRHEPNLELARKLERFLHITLVEESEEVSTEGMKSSKKGEYTLGDFVKVRKR